MFLKKQGFPQEGELVLCTVTKVQHTPVFARLDEFENKSMNDLKYQEYFLIFIPLIFLGMFLIKKLLIKQRK